MHALPRPKGIPLMIAVARSSRPGELCTIHFVRGHELAPAESGQMSSGPRELEERRQTGFCGPGSTALAAAWREELVLAQLAPARRSTRRPSPGMPGGPEIGCRVPVHAFDRVGLPCPPLAASWPLCTGRCSYGIRHCLMVLSPWLARLRCIAG